MKIKNIKDAAKKKATRSEKVVDIKKIIKMKEERAGKLKKLQEVRTIARIMRIDTRNVTLTELVRAIQRTEGNIDCYMSARVLTCSEKSCLWREYCAPH
jgi:hypothetical protein